MIVWLLDLDLGGTVFRYATAEASVVDGGTTLVYRSGLSQPVVDMTVDGPSGRSVALEVSGLPIGYASWPEVPHIRQMLEEGTATLRRWREGETLSQAQTLARGSCSMPSLQRGAESLVISIESPPWQDGTRIIPTTSMVSRETYPTPTAKTGSEAVPDQMIVGSYPPVVIGTPGDVRSIEWAGVAPSDQSVQGPPSFPTSRVSKWAELGEGSPALKVETNVGVWSWWDRLAIASHPVAASSVIIWDQSDERWDLFPVQHEVNALGDTFAFVDSTSLSGMWVRAWMVGHEFWTVWLSDYGGGLVSDKGGTMTGLGEVLKWMLAKMSAPVALSAQQGERGELDEYKIHAFINTDITVWEWISAEVMELFPVRWVEVDGGGYLRHWDLSPGAQPVAHIDCDTQGVDIVSDLLCDNEDVRNYLTLRYAYGPSGVHKSLTLAAEAGPSGSTVRANLLCQRSEARYGRRAYTWESRLVADDATAARMLYALAREHALGRWSVIVEDPESAYLEHMIPGDRVSLTSSAFGLTAQPCIVVGPVYDGVSTRVMLRLIEED